MIVRRRNRRMCRYLGRRWLLSCLLLMELAGHRVLDESRQRNARGHARLG